MDLPLKKPMAAARRASLFDREVRVRLSSAAVEILFERASILSEGQVEGGGYYGSTMITMDCARASHLVSEECDASLADQVADLAGTDERVRERARDIAYREARRLATVELYETQIDVRVRASGTHIHFDLDVEATGESKEQARAQ